MSIEKSCIRSQRVESTLHRAIVSSLVKLDIDGCIVTRVEVNKDLKSAKVYYVVSHNIDQEVVHNSLIKHRGAIAKESLKIYHGRSVPKISFILDKGAEKASRIYELLDIIAKEQPKV